jgi:hypothetical protein
MEMYLQMETQQADIGKFCRTEKQIIQKQYQYYSFGEFKLYCLACTENHFFLVSLKFNATDVKRIFL